MVPNQATVGLGGDGTFKVYAAGTTHVPVDVAGYYAAPGAGLYYHPLPRPVRLVDTRPGEPACAAGGGPLAAGGERTQGVVPDCTGVPADAQAIVGNATVDNSATLAPGGYVSLWPAGTARPTVSTLNYTPGQVVPNAFIVGRGGAAFGIYATSGTHLIVDVTGYYSDQAADATGAGLRYTPLAAPVRLLDTRPGQPACDMPGTPLAPGVERTQPVLPACTLVPTGARALVGNATVDNGATWAPGGYVTLWPAGATRPVASNLNYAPGQVVANAFTVGLEGGAFNVFVSSGTHFLVDVVGSFVSSSGTPPPPPPPRAGDPMLVGAGDIASCSSSGDEATAALLDAIAGTVFTTGDNVYDSGSAAEFANCYQPSWGRHKGRTRPSAGNHDYGTAGAAGYFNYFGAAAGDPSRGYYNYDLGAWHIVVLNSNCARVACAAGSAQERWLRADLAAHPSQCTLAYWHHPRWSSGHGGSDTSVQPFWQALADHGADVVLAGHSHHYERFAPMDAAGGRAEGGIRSFVVGPGGAFFTGVGSPVANSEVRNNDTFGVLKLTLRPGGYDWRFVPVAGKTFSDAGSSACH